MCGIVGYIGNKKVVNVLLDGLKKLEYRGYDSAGIALKNNEDIRVVKSVGRIKQLEEKLDGVSDLFDSGIGHTRWATNGSVNLENAHPHRVGKVTIVHNGIIENAYELRKELEDIEFISDTDSYLIAALINKYLDDNIINTLEKVSKKLKGSYAVGVLIDDIDKVFLMKNKSPLVIGIGDNDNYFASDITAINKYTNKYIFLDDLEIASIDKKNISIYKDLKLIEKEVEIINSSYSDSNKLEYDHYMLKEIKEEPILLKKLVDKYINNMEKLPDISKYDEVHIVGCGSALYAGMIGKWLFEEKANIKTLAETASEYRYKNNIYSNKTLIILISQSGETADTIAVLEKAKEDKIDTLAIVNVASSKIARESDMKVLIEAGEEVAVATTKAYLQQVAVLSLLSFKSAIEKNLIKDSQKIIDEFKNISNLLAEEIKSDEPYKKLADQIYKSNDIFFIGRALDYAIALEGSLKLKEVSYIHSEAYPAGELKHGTISLVEEGMPVIGIVSSEKLYEKTISNLLEVSSRGAKTVLISKKKFNNSYKGDLLVDDVSDFTVSLLIVPMLQLIAYYTALKRGCDIDKPKNLAKSVTVE